MEDQDWLLLSLIGKHKSITQIAEELYTSQPALSYRIKKIETYFDMELLLRTNRGLRLTPQGEKAIDFANKHLNDLERLKEEMLSIADMPKGPLRIGASNAIAQYQLPKFFLEFHSMYKDVDLSLETGFSEHLIDLLLENKIHIAFLRDDLEWDFYKVKLSSEPVYIVSKQYIDKDDLPNMPRIMYKTNPSLKGLLAKWWSDNFNVSPKTFMTVDNAETSIEIVRSGLGYSILPSLTLGEAKDLYKIPIYNEKNEMIERGIWMYTDENTQNYITARKFVEYILSKFS